MKSAALFGLAALLPSAIAAAPPTIAQTVSVTLCGRGLAGTKISIPLRRGPDDPATDGDCHPKGCHGANPRKRAVCHI